MLTKSDLSKIGQVVTQAVKPIKQDVSVLKQDVSVLKQDVSGLKQDVGVLKKDVSGLKQDTKKIKTTLDGFIDYFDNQYLDHEKRIGHIENHLKLTNPPLFT